MSDVLRIKRRLAGGASGAPASLKNAELAFNEQDNTLYYGKGDSGGNATSIIAVGGPGAFQPLDADLTAFAALTGTNTIYYRSGADTWSPVTMGGNMTFSGGVLNSTGGAGVAIISPPQGRLTLQSLTPVMTITQAAKTTIYYTPQVGNLIPLYDGTNFVMTSIGTEISALTTDATKSPAAIGASKVNDWFVWNDAGTIRLGHGPDWTNDTTRSAGTALVMVNGIRLNSAAITNGPAAQRGTYVGTTRSNASSQFDWIVGATNTAAFLGVWNCYNRVDISMSVIEPAASWTVPAGIRPLNNSVMNRVSAVFGLQENGVSIIIIASGIAAVGGHIAVSVGFNSTTAQAGIWDYTAVNSAAIPLSAAYIDMAPLGFNFWQALERSAIAGATMVSNQVPVSLSGLTFQARM